MLKYYLRLFGRFIIISWRRVRAFNFEFIMLFIHLFFSFSFILVFWFSLFQHINAFGDWSFSELALYSGITYLGESIGGIFFGFRDLPSRILSGNLDKFLVRPINTLFAVLFEQVSVVYFLQQFIASIILINIIIFTYSIKIQILDVVAGLILLVVGVFIFNCIYGMITFLAFWVGKVEVFRSIIFGVLESKQYPVTIFPRSIQTILTFIIPVALISYYPTALFLGKVQLSVPFSIKIFGFMVTILYLFNVTWRQGLKRYEANGG